MRLELWELGVVKTELTPFGDLQGVFGRLARGSLQRGGINLTTAHGPLFLLGGGVPFLGVLLKRNPKGNLPFWGYQNSYFETCVRMKHSLRSGSTPQTGPVPQKMQRRAKTSKPG